MDFIAILKTGIHIIMHKIMCKIFNNDGEYLVTYKMILIICILLVKYYHNYK